ncbi:MAG: hypothetical protein COA73_04785 [Candidatus Hydrogenedentota bacterium]|nr:MAG: hypothetical protein COA73_04785 [Candidatus Hydrogenedentota bacterium]
MTENPLERCPGESGGVCAERCPHRGEASGRAAGAVSTPHFHRTIQLIHSLGKKAGISLNPGTPVEVLDNVMDMVDLILVMSVNPGFGGQKFIMSQLEKIRRIRKMIDATGRDIDLQVDGGINVETAKLAIAAGADVLVAGTATFTGGPSHYEANIRNLRGE